jgi:uncharacterized phage protein (TIGR01671 family)
MREILFRGKRADNGEWVEGQLLFFKASVGTEAFALIVESCEWDNANEWFNLGKRAKAIPETVGQFTGMTDKNGKKIFEGDIVWFEDESPSNYEYHDCTEMRCGAIEYGDNCFYITNRIAVEMEDLIYDGKLDVEVIGNIHDNPELLKGGEAE